MLKSAGEKDPAGPQVPELFTVAFTVARWELFSCCVVKLEFGSNRRSSVSVMLSGHWALQRLGERLDVPWTFPDWQLVQLSCLVLFFGFFFFSLKQDFTSF